MYEKDGCYGLRIPAMMKWAVWVWGMWKKQPIAEDF